MKLHTLREASGEGATSVFVWAICRKTRAGVGCDGLFQPSYELCAFRRSRSKLMVAKQAPPDNARQCGRHATEQSLTETRQPDSPTARHHTRQCSDSAPTLPDSTDSQGSTCCVRGPHPAVRSVSA